MRIERTRMIGSLGKSDPSAGQPRGFSLLVGLLLVSISFSPTPLAATEPVSSVIGDLVLAEWLREDDVFRSQAKSGGPVDVGPCSTSEDASGGCDGVKNGLWGFHVASGEQDPWWQVDLGDAVLLDRVVVHNRGGSSAARTAKLEILIGVDAPTADPPAWETVYRHPGKPFGGVTGEPLVARFDDRPVTARVVRLRIPGSCSFALDEVEVYGADAPEKNIALGRPADQISTSPYSYPGTMPDSMFRKHHFEPVVARVDVDAPVEADADTGRFRLSHAKLHLERARALIERLRLRGAQPLLTSLDELEAEYGQLRDSVDVSEPTRRDFYLRSRQLKRRIAMANPLLDIDRLLFIKRYDSTGVFHMCDQYYGCNARPGGGLYVLEDPMGENPTLVDLLAESVVENGRLAGEKLQGGAFLSPEVSFDGRTILFAYTEAKAWDKYHGGTAYEWTPEYCHHLFKVHVDGSGLVQLTDGAKDDFDPCFLPNGRIAFVSQRRGGYLRCGRHCPVYTIHGMRADGSDIIRLSYHETHEWHPSVTNDGMMIYTRWDYVDRDTNIAHHPWTSYPDGRDPRSFHGNYPERRESRPWMEMSIRAIPASNRFVAVAAAHHGHAFGSLVLIDPRTEDDGAMSQLERLTPEAPFPESAGRPTNRHMVYGTPWPLSEDDYLCVRDEASKNRGIYWIDRDGNRELIYRDPEISCLSPMPLRPRQTPPVIPSGTTQAVEDRGKPEGDATVVVMNAYDSDFDWPEGTRIEALRIIQVLPKTTAPPNQPRIGVAAQTNARAVLGTVPVEADGSAYFEAPVGKAIYFQAIDQHGTAVQSMRSATYVHAGERLTCQGCHERKHKAATSVSVSMSDADQRPMALRRPPSPIQADVDGSNPFNYTRLVQPVLDRNCVACHQEKQALDLSGTVGASNGWTRSYANLAGKYGFYYSVTNGSISRGGSRTPAGKFGARAAKLTEYLDEKHHGVTLSREDRHRLTLWLDCNSEFFGSYEETEAQARGEVVRPTLE